MVIHKEIILFLKFDLSTPAKSKNINVNIHMYISVYKKKVKSNEIYEPLDIRIQISLTLCQTGNKISLETPNSIKSIKYKIKHAM